jgi:P4 family phage/plasmid primase-like protien
MNARQIYDLGFTDLVSVVPPGAKLTANSKLRPEALGKTPGKRSHSGEWYGYNWQAAGPATLREVAQWTADGANIGLRAGSFPAVDIDCNDEQLVSIIRDLAIEHLGHAPERQGRAPKSLLIYRTSASFGRMRLWIDGRKHLVEVLGDGQQYVVAGTHPTTARPYVWKLPLVPVEDLSEIGREGVERFLQAVADMLDLLGYQTEREGTGGLTVDRETIDQAAHLADLSKLAEAMDCIPNDNESFPGRDDYLRIGYALKAAAGDAAYPLFAEWAAKWEGNENAAGNDEETVRADWDRMKPPYEVGANFLFDTARDHGYSDADEFEAIDRPADEGQDDGADGGAIAYSDAALASRFLKKHIDEVRYCPAMGGWMVWNGSTWARDTHRQIRYWVGVICKRASAEALRTIEEKGTAHKVATRVASNSSKNAVIDYAADHPAVAVRADQFDANPMLLNTPAGIVNLETGVMQKHDPKHLMTKITKCGPADRKPSLWLSFLDEATAGDKDLQAYLQRFCGYSLTGQTNEHTLTFFHGAGGNGKGTFINAITAIWQDYARTSPMATFTASRIDAHPTAIADLAGARFVQSQETDEARRWDEAKIKSLTGGDPVTARFMRADFFTYLPQFKLCFAGNHRPTINNLDRAMRRRFHLIPFTVEPKKVDTTLNKRLEADYPAILQWAIEGALEWQKHGLQAPRAVLDATAEYFEDADPLANWLRERTARVAGEFRNSHSLYDDWREWCGMVGEAPRSEKRFVQALESKGFARKKQGGTGLRGFLGLALTQTPGSEFAAA